MIALLMLPVMFAPPIATPIDALRQQRRCESQIEIQRLVRRCAQVLAPGFSVKRPVKGMEPVWPAGTDVVDRLDRPIDARTLAATLGEPTVIGRESVYPNAIQAPGGVCGVAVGARSDPIRSVRLFKASAPAVRPVRDARCLAPEQVQGLQKLCAHAWFNDVERIQRLAQGIEPPSVSDDHVLKRAEIFASRTQTGVQASLSKAKIRPHQLDVVFGPPAPKGTRRSYRHAPPFDQIGRTCTVDAAFVDGVVFDLRVERGPQYAQPPHPTVALSASTRSVFEAIEQTCREGASLSAKARGHLSSRLGMPAQGYPRGYIRYRSGIASLRYADLLARYGGSIAKRERRYSDHFPERVPHFEGHHQFRVPGASGRACTLEVVVDQILRPVDLNRLYFRAPIPRL